MALKLEEQLLKIREAAEEREAERKAAETGLPYLDLRTAPVKVDALRIIPEEQARELKVAAFELKKPILALAAYEPGDPKVQASIVGLKEQGYEVKIFIASLRGLEHLWSFYRFVSAEKRPITSRVNIERERIMRLSAELSGLENAARAAESFDFEEGSVTEFLEVVLAGALANRASDIHFEPGEHSVKIRYRIDGILHDVTGGAPPDFYRAVVSRVKLLSKMKINVSDRPQDGRFTIGLAAKEVEIRIAAAPSEFGEIVVMRVLDPDVINLSLQELGLRGDDLAIIEVELKRPNGMMLNTGPTGSGKTSTLYAFLKAKETPEVKIITIEDPIEYHLEGIEQTQVDEEAGYTFANGLKSIMRQDPDAILVGEVRDRDTAEIAIQAALTGHLVFSTVHANEAAGSIPRLLDLGVKPSSIGSALNLVIGQRLVRRLCLSCRSPRKASPAFEERIQKFVRGLPSRVDRSGYNLPTPFEAKGCGSCSGLGYKGRIAIFELFLNDPAYEEVKRNPSHRELASEAEFDALVNRGASEAMVREYGRRHGMVTMQEDGILKAIQGVTTFQEVEEATGPIPWLPEDG